MNTQNALPPKTDRAFARANLGPIEADAAAKILASVGDVAMIVDADGIVRDLAVGNLDLARDGVGDWLDKRWADLVTVESRIKVEELLRDASDDGRGRWREINHATPRGGEIAVRYIAVGVGDRAVVIGRDHRAAAALQQRLIQAQQALERDYARLRDAEARYRLLFQLATEPVVIVDAASKKIVEANPAAERLVGGADSGLIGRAFAKAFDADSQEDAAALLAVANAAARANDEGASLRANGRAFSARASIFRVDRTSLFLVRLAPADDAGDARPRNQRLIDVLERLPDAFVVTDADLRILECNEAFLRLARIGSREHALQHSLGDYLARTEVERDVLVAGLREHGTLLNYASVLRDTLGGSEGVELSAVHVPDVDTPCFGFMIRLVGRRLNQTSSAVAQALPRSVEQLSQLVGRVTLKELVRETTDIVERLCIEAALELTDNNRASAAEILGLSRQSLYSKLHRYGIDFGDEA
ncbi:MAG: transcriptional regulator PpsR [Alphaproteobacteria bacterium]|nr:transcriptional regulator PpsR [Alphaproteobacteria bacterium]